MNTKTTTVKYVMGPVYKLDSGESLHQFAVAITAGLWSGFYWVTAKSRDEAEKGWQNAGIKMSTKDIENVFPVIVREGMSC